MARINEFLDELKRLNRTDPAGWQTFEAERVADALGMDRSTVSRYLNQLEKGGVLHKSSGRPVRFQLGEGFENPQASSVHDDETQTAAKAEGNHGNRHEEFSSLDMIIGAKDTLHVAVQQAKAAIMYPPRGLHTLILGETGVGKSMFAELMYRFSKESGVIAQNAPFVKFNCADYAENPQLLVAQIFGVKKGAYTGADKDKDGLLKKADKGILFLDEVHRLSHQGQEMLFTFIDKGHFRKLGDTENMDTAQVQIIAATTEDPASFLLKTFTRRIPMAITLAPLRERTLKERYELVCTFIREESKRVSKSLYINRNALISLLLYPCTNNIGQLRGDIQLACAKAFLSYKSKNRNYILINNGDLPLHVAKAVIDLKTHRDTIDQLLKSHDDLFKFSYDEEIPSLEWPDEEQGVFYDRIEKKLTQLRDSGVEDEEIRQILDIDIDRHFQRYIGDLPERYMREELEKIVDPAVIDLVSDMLTVAKERLGREYDDKIRFGLALHLHSSIERLRKGGRIFHPKLNVIRVSYPDEFLVSMELAKLVDERFSIEVSLDEIGYLTMFIAAQLEALQDEEESKVAVLVMMHGVSTASSMTQVANQLVGVEHAYALDMPLNMRAPEMYERAKEMVMRIDRGKGVLLLVDMGSLSNFGDIIQGETGIRIRSLELVSTLIVIEGCRKAVLGRELDDIVESLQNERVQFVGEDKQNVEKPKLILTTCFTGEGAAERLQAMVLKELKDLGATDAFKVKTITAMERQELDKRLRDYDDRYEIVAIIGTVSVTYGVVPFISAVSYLSGEGKEKLRRIIQDESMGKRIAKSLKEHIATCDTDKLVMDVGKLLQSIMVATDRRINDEVYTGMLLHMCFLTDRRIRGEGASTFEGLEAFIESNHVLFNIIRSKIQAFEAVYRIRIEPQEIAHLCRMIIENAESV